MILSHQDLKHAIDEGRLRINPYHTDSLQPASIDLRLGNRFIIQRMISNPVDPYDLDEYPEGLEHVTVDEGEPFTLYPGQFVLGHTLEHVSLPENLAANLSGKSTLGRIGLVIHQTAGYIDSGFVGDVTLELSNVSPRPILLWPGMWIGQIVVHQLSYPVDMPYGSTELGSHYQGQSGPTPPKSLRRPSVGTVLLHPED